MASEPGQKALEVIIIQWGQGHRNHKISLLLGGKGSEQEEVHLLVSNELLFRARLSPQQMV